MSSQPKTNGKQKSSTYKPSQDTSKYDGSNFVECNMGAEDKAHFRSNPPNPEQVFDWLDRMLLDGHKLSLSYSQKFDCYQVFLTSSAEGSPTRGMCLSGRAASMAMAFAVLYYKHVVMLDGVWTSQIGRDFEPDRLG